MSHFAKKLSFTVALGLAAATMTMAARADDSPSMAPQRVSAQDATGAASATAQWVNVSRGDTVSFEQNGQRYTLHLNKGADGVDLSTLAPKGSQLSGVSVAVTADKAN
jgi:hypothetical protein